MAGGPVSRGFPGSSDPSLKPMIDGQKGLAVYGRNRYELPEAIGLHPV
jgi:hypothetical protein